MVAKLPAKINNNAFLLNTNINTYNNMISPYFFCSVSFYWPQHMNMANATYRALLRSNRRKLCKDAMY